MLDSEVFSYKPKEDEDNNLVDGQGSEDINDSCLLYCERFMEFLIDLLSQLPTRRYICSFSFLLRPFKMNLVFST